VHFTLDQTSCVRHGIRERAERSVRSTTSTAANRRRHSAAGPRRLRRSGGSCGGGSGGGGAGRHSVRDYRVTRARVGLSGERAATGLSAVGC